MKTLLFSLLLFKYENLEIRKRKDPKNHKDWEI